MIKISLVNLAKQLSKLENGIYYMCMVDVHMKFLEKPNGIVLGKLNKYSNNFGNNFRLLTDLLNKVTIAYDDKVEEYYIINGYLASNPNKNITVKFDDKRNHWYSIKNKENKNAN